MPRLRITASLSALALGIGIAGTQWLSGMSGGVGPDAMRAGHRAFVRHAMVSHGARHGAWRAVAASEPRRIEPVTPIPDAQVARNDAPVQWIPISMPVSSVPYARIRDHAVGRVVLHLVVDAQGQVADASLVQSSGDAVLDANALQMARQWRFALPPGHPDGFSGNLPLDFTAGSTQVAQAP